MDKTMTETAVQLLENLKYQVYHPAVTTMAPCSNGCGEAARGGKECWKCLAKKLQDRLKGRLEELSSKRNFLTEGVVNNLTYTVTDLLYSHREMHSIEDLCNLYDNLDN